MNLNSLHKELFKEETEVAAIDLAVVDLFYDNFTNKNARKSFTHKNRFHILYWFLSEYYSELSENGQSHGAAISFDINKRKFHVTDDKLLFSLVIHLKRRLEARFDIKTTNYPKWMKKEQYWGFKNALESLLSKEVFKKSIFNGRPKNVPIIKNQLEALALVKGSMNKEAVEKIIAIIYQLNPGARNSKFKNYACVVRLANKLYDECKFSFYSGNANLLGSSDVDEKWKKLRITKKKCMKYILYWGAISTLQQYHNKALEVSSRRETAFFSHAYVILRAGLVNMNLLKCADPTFCPGVRSRTWQTKVMLAVGQKPANYRFSLNNIEAKYNKIISYNDKDQFAFNQSIYASQYLPEKIRAYDNFLYFKQAGKMAGSSSFMAFKLYKDDLNKKYQCMEQANMYKNEKMEYARKVAKFHLKYSDPHAYDWMPETGEVAV